MPTQVKPRQAVAQWLLVCLVAFSLLSTAAVIWTAAVGASAQAAPRLPWEPGPTLGSTGQPLTQSASEVAPIQPAETFTNRGFWMVLGLVVLGSFILRADFPDSN